MNASLINILACPMDKHDLELQTFVQDTEENIIEGMLHCPQCRRYYPIIYGIPILSPDEYREFSLEAPLVKRWENRLPGAITKEFLLTSGDS